MTTYSATFSAEHLDTLRRHLIRDDGGCEHAAYVLFNRSLSRIDPWDREAHQKFLSAQVIPVPDDQVVESTPNLITWRTASFIAALKLAETKSQVVAIAHNHLALPGFSEQDDANEPELLQLARNRNGPETSLLSFILTQDGHFIGRIWQSVKYHAPLRMIRVIGDVFNLHYPGRSAGGDALAFQRQALAFGKTLNRDLSMLRVGIVGCGGTGSAVAMLLARLGVGQLLLIDNDIVDRSNLNRLHGARQADADAMRPKVEVVARSITELGLGVRVIAKEAWVADPECRDALRCCDIIFGCTDDHEGRFFLNRFAIFYRAPVFDTGLHISVADGQPPTINTLDGRVSVLVEGKTCLSCRGTISPLRAAEEVLRRTNPGEYERRKAEAYVIGSGDPSPAVVTFTTEVATMAVNELLHRLQGFRGADGAISTQVRRFHLMTDFRPGAKPKPGCPLCDSNAYCGLGDVDPFLDRA